nr:hypothetical protein [Anaerolineales bacterium]
LQALRGRGWPIAADALQAGLRAVRWPGRFEILQSRPFVVVDGAHNQDSARRLAAALRDYFPGRRVILIFGASADKDIPGMLDELLPQAARLILSQAVHPRAIEPEQLARLAAERGVAVEVRAPVAAALEYALETAGPEDVVVACGSLFIVAEVQTAQAARRAAVPARRE